MATWSLGVSHWWTNPSDNVGCLQKHLTFGKWNLVSAGFVWKHGATQFQCFTSIISLRIKLPFWGIRPFWTNPVSLHQLPMLCRMSLYVWWLKPTLHFWWLNQLVIQHTTSLQPREQHGHHSQQRFHRGHGRPVSAPANSRTQTWSWTKEGPGPKTFRHFSDDQQPVRPSTWILLGRWNCFRAF